MTSVPEGGQPWHSSEPIERYESLFPLLPNFVAHYTIGGRRIPRIGIANRIDLQFRKSLLAALVAGRAQIGLSYAEKRYAKDATETRWLGLTEKIDRIYGDGRGYLDQYQLLGRSAGSASRDDLSWQFFFRAIGSFDAAKRLSELGYLCETATILRSALEQFMFCARLLSRKPSEDIKAIRPVQCLNFFKTFVPNAGSLYGHLSKYTHFEFAHHSHFFTYSPDEVQTLGRSSILRAYATHLLFLTMASVGRYIATASSSQFEDVPKSVSDVRIFLDAVNNFSIEVREMLPSDGVLADMDNLLGSILKQES